MSSTTPRSPLFALLFVTLAHAAMVVNKVDIGDTSAITSSLRDNGDVWNPSIEGTNILECGAPLNDLPASRHTMAADQPITIWATILNAMGGGKWTASIKYGRNANFLMGEGWTLDCDFEQGDHNLVDDVDDNTFSRPCLLPAVVFNGPGTIQVEFEVSQNDTFVQCIDLDFTGGVDPPEGDFPFGHGNPDKTPTQVTVRTAGGGPTPGFNWFHVILIILAVLILILLILIIIFCCCKKEEEKEPPLAPVDSRQAPVYEAMDEPQAPMEPSVETHVEAPKFSESEPEPNSRSESRDLADDAGSRGRHFHFRYV